MTTLDRPIAPSREALKTISDRFEQSEPHEILQWAIETYGSGLTMATAFGAEGCALLAMLGEQVQSGRSVHVFNLETGYQFTETLALREQVREKYGIEVAYVRAKESVEEMEARFGGPIYGTHPDECCRIRKVAPLKDALAGRTAWITAIRRDQTSHRAQADIIEWDPKFQPRQDQPACQLVEGRGLGLPRHQRSAVQPTARPGLSEYRLLALHPRRLATRRRPLGALVHLCKTRMRSAHPPLNL